MFLGLCCGPNQSLTDDTWILFLHKDPSLGDKLFGEIVEVELLTCQSKEVSQWWLQQMLDNSFIYPKSKVLLFWTLDSWCSSKAAAIPTMQQVTSCQAESKLDSEPSYWPSCLTSSSIYSGLQSFASNSKHGPSLIYSATFPAFPTLNNKPFACLISLVGLVGASTTWGIPSCTQEDILP